MKRGYYVVGFGEYYGVAVVASSAKEAKSIAYKAGCFMDEDWIDINSNGIKDADVSNMLVCVVSSPGEGLKRGLFTFINDICEGRGTERDLALFQNRALCVDCIEKEEKQ